MAKIIEFEQPQEEKYLEDMTREELETYLAQLEDRIAALDAKEPKSMNSEAYEVWADEHEMLEDAADEVREFLDEI